MPGTDSTSPPGPQGSHSHPNTHSVPSGLCNPFPSIYWGWGRAGPPVQPGVQMIQHFPHLQKPNRSQGAALQAPRSSQLQPTSGTDRCPPPRPGSIHRSVAASASSEGASPARPGGGFGSPGWFSERARTPPQTRGGRCWVQAPPASRANLPPQGTPPCPMARSSLPGLRCQPPALTHQDFIARVATMS